MEEKNKKIWRNYTNKKSCRAALKLKKLQEIN